MTLSAAVVEYRVGARGRQVVALLALFVATCLAAYVLPLHCVDFRAFFYPAVWADGPYAVPGVYNPPWTFAILAPVALFPLEQAEAIHFAVSLFAIAFVLRRLDVPLAGAAGFVCSLPVVLSLCYGQLEWLVLAALLLPARWGILLALIKPQVGIGLVVWWLVEAHRERHLWRTVEPLVACLACAFIVWRWPMQLLAPPHTIANATFWPWLVPVGVWAFWRLLERPSLGPALLVGPCLSSHLTPGSWSGVMLAVARKPWAIWATNAVTWGLVLVQAR
jgi:hypothetical protein